MEGATQFPDTKADAGSLLGAVRAGRFAVIAQTARHGHPREVPRDAFVLGPAVEADELCTYLIDQRLRALEDLVLTRIHAAAGEADLDDAIESVLEDEAYHALIREIKELTTVAAVARITDTPPPELLELAGEDTPLLVEAMKLSVAVLRAATQLAVTYPSEDSDDSAKARSPLFFLDDRKIPAEISRAILGGLQAEVCSIAFGARARTKGPLPEWLRGAILARWIRGQRRLLRLLASFPGVKVEEELVSDSEKIDLRRLAERMRRSEAGYQARLDQAKRSGSPVFPPVGHLDD